MVPDNVKEMVLVLFDVTTLQVGASLVALPDEALGNCPEDCFGVAEGFTHLMQADRFNIAWVVTLAQGKVFEAREPFILLMAIADIQERQSQLRALNFEAARQATVKIATMTELVSAWLSRRQAVRQELANLDLSLWGNEIVHPLVPMIRGLVWSLCVQLFCFHSYYHTGQENRALKTLKLGHRVPFIFGLSNTEATDG